MWCDAMCRKTRGSRDVNSHVDGEFFPGSSVVAIAFPQSPPYNSALSGVAAQMSGHREAMFTLSDG